MSLEIIVPGRFIEPKDPIGMTVGMEGWFTLSAIKNGRVVCKHTFKEQLPAEVGPFHNLLLNQGLNRFATFAGADVYGYFQVGTGTSTPTVTQLQLDARVGNPFGYSSQISSTISNSGAPYYYSARIFTGLSSIGAFGTVNLTEVGIGGNGAALLFSRALILDSNGNPVSFPISSDEQLQISYELRLYPPLSDANFTVNVSGTRNVIVRALGVTDTSYWGVVSPSAGANVTGANAPPGQNNNFWTGGLNPITSSAPQGSSIPSVGGRVVTNSAYSVDSYKRGCRWSWPSTSANGTIRTHGVGWNFCQFQVQYDPPIVKTSDQTLYLDYEIAWARR